VKNGKPNNNAHKNTRHKTGTQTTQESKPPYIDQAPDPLQVGTSGVRLGSTDTK